MRFDAMRCAGEVRELYARLIELQRKGAPSLVVVCRRVSLMSVIEKYTTFCFPSFLGRKVAAMMQGEFALIAGECLSTLCSVVFFKY